MDEWHANHFSSQLRNCISIYGYDAKIECAYAIKDKENGLTTDEWCKVNHVRKVTSIEELIAQVDAIFVFAPDNSELHEELCDLPFRSGKPVFVDKTFAPDLETAKRMFSLANEYNTPVFTTSSLRYCKGIVEFLKAKHNSPKFMSTLGANDLRSYGVHQIDPINAIMGYGVEKIKCFSVGDAVNVILSYPNGRLATFTQIPNSYVDFTFSISDGESNSKQLDSGDYTMNFLKEILDFYETKISPVSQKDMLEVLAIIDTAYMAKENQDTWINILS